MDKVPKLRPTLKAGYYIPALVSLIGLSASVWLSTPAFAEDADRPLGILLSGVERTTPPIRSSLPANILTPNPTTTSTAVAAPAPVARPLGILFNATSTSQKNPSSVLPQGWNKQPTRSATSTSQTATSTTQAGADRPLGTLFNAPAPLQRPAVPTPSSARTVRTPAIQPASRVQSAPNHDASYAKPLGTLFIAQPTGSNTEQQPPASTTRTVQAPVGAPTPTAQTEPAPIAAEFSADSMTYDRELGIVTATGNVEIVYGERALFANKVMYNQKTDVVIADGSVSLTDPSGKVLLGDKMEITGDLKDGVVYNIGLVLEDHSRVAGSGARRSNAQITEISNAVYSPCDLCEEDPTAAPLWQLKAVRVIHDVDKKLVSYRDAWLELFGVPVAYTPYLSHPDPTVKRKSGLLAPSFSNSSDLGFRLNTPYFWAIDEHQDATITPMLASDGGQGLIGQYRRNFKNGFVKSDASFVVDDDAEGERGYIDFESAYHINRTWRAGLDLQGASDDTYIRRYGFDTESILVSRGYLEGFRGQNYQVLNTYAFQDLRQDEDASESPFALPMYDFNYMGKRDDLGGFSSLDFNVLNLIRNSGTDTRRIAVRPRWERPFNGHFGELYKASVSLAADAYHASGVIRDDRTEFTGVSGRVLPTASLSWRLPLIRTGEEINQTIEPLASVAISPNGGNPDKIPNEDSQEPEFDETNLFRDNRFDGFDRVDSGLRFNYGLNWVILGRNKGDASVFIGQSYRPRTSNSFSLASGLEDNFSDFVGRVQVTPAKYLNVLYRTQFSPDNFSPKHNEITAKVGTPALNLNSTYIFIDQQQDSEFAGREELSGSIQSKFNENWSTSMSARHDMNANDLLSLGLQLVYEDECVKFTTQFARSIFEDRDIQPTDSVTFTLVLKTLGEVRTGASSSQ